MMRLHFYSVQEHTSPTGKGDILSTRLSVADYVYPSILVTDNLRNRHEVRVAPSMIEMMVGIKHIAYWFSGYGTYLAGNIAVAV